jgi:GNAT superfamily N-acetyltransferase
LEPRRLLDSERDEAIETLAAAFDEDPLFVWFLPHKAQRRKWLGWFHGRVLNETMPLGGAFTLGAGEGMLLTYLPGAWPPSFLTGLRAWPMFPGLPTWRLLRPGLWIDGRIHQLHPKEPHLYVYVLGVHPSRQGKGLGGKLLRHASTIADAARVPCHLETAKPENVELYRRFGYEVQTEITEHGGPPLWTMTRPAR